MNDTDFEILQMYYEDGLREVEIAKITGLSVATIHEVLAAFETMLPDPSDDTSEDTQMRFEF